MTPAATPLLTMVIALFGLLAGSFLNVCIYRLPRKQSVRWPGSHCTACQRRLTWFENIPLVSWVVLRGRCRTCAEAISPMYPAVEAITAAVFVGAYALYGLTPLFAVRVLFAGAMIVLFAIDLRHRILPNVITLPGIAAGLVFSLWLPPGWRSSLIGLIVGGGILFAIGEVYARLRGIEGMGMGDVKMLAMIGAFLGWELMLLTLVLASFAGSFVGIGIMMSGRGDMKAALPFGTFLAVGALIAAVVGEPMIVWYVGLYS